MTTYFYFLNDIFYCLHCIHILQVIFLCFFPQPPSGLPVLNPSELVTTFDSIVAAQNPFDEHHQGHHPQGYPGQQMPPGPGMHNMGGMHGPPYSMHNKMGPGMGMMRMPMPGQNGPPSHPNTGKTYPPDQPMVFNAANPNAPPIYPCGVCHKEVHDNDQAILCESGCNFWFHRICTGLSEPAYQMLTKEVYAEWVCDSCLSTKSIPLVKMKP